MLSEKRRRTLGRLARLSLAAILASWLLYVLAGNALLLSGVIEKYVTGSGKSQELKFDHAWTLWPGRVHARHVQLRIEDSTMQGAILVDRADLDIRLLSLLNKTFHTRQTRVEGLRFLLRFKVVSPLGLEERAAAWPPIPGRADPPLTGPKELSPPDKADRNWAVTIEGVRARLRELWIADYHYQGPGEARGSFHLKPERRIEVGPASVSLEGGDVVLGSRPVLRGVRAHISCLLPGYDPRQVKGNDVLRRMRAEIQVRGTLDDVRFASVYLPRAKVRRVEGGHGTLDAALHLHHARLLPSSRAELNLHDLSVDAGPTRFHSDMKLLVNVGQHAGENGPAVRLELPSVQVRLVREPQSAAGPAVLSGIELEAATRYADVTAPLELVRGRILVANADAEVAFVDRLIGGERGWHAVKGRAHVGLGLHLGESGGWGGAVDASLRGVKVKGKRWRAGGSATLHAEVHASPRGVRGTVSDLSLALDRISFRGPLASAERWWARAEIPRVSWNGMPPKRLDGSIRVRGRDAEAILKSMVGKGWIPNLALDVVGTTGLQASARFRRERGSTQVVLEQARTGRIRASGGWARRQKASTGAFLVESSGLVVGIGVGKRGTQVKPGAGQDWLNRELARRGFHEARRGPQGAGGAAGAGVVPGTTKSGDEAGE